MPAGILHYGPEAPSGWTLDCVVDDKSGFIVLIPGVRSTTPQETTSSDGKALTTATTLSRHVGQWLTPTTAGLLLLTLDENLKFY